jgi:hypothetical protein
VTIERRQKKETMKIRYSKRGAVVFLIGIMLAGCVGSPSVLEPHGMDAARIASLTWLMFAIAGIVLIIISALLWMAYQRSRQDRSDVDLYAGDRTSLRNVMLGGGLAPFVILLIVMGLGIGVENAAATANLGGNAEANLDIEIIGHQWWWEVHYTNQDFDTANKSISRLGKLSRCTSPPPMSFTAFGCRSCTARSTSSPDKRTHSQSKPTRPVSIVVNVLSSAARSMRTWHFGSLLNQQISTTLG